MLECDNIKLFSFNHIEEMTTNLDNYMDILHYGEWINSFALEAMAKKKCLLSVNNYNEYLKEIERIYKGYNYSVLIQP